jgi:hypothetical protein
VNDFIVFNHTITDDDWGAFQIMDLKFLTVESGVALDRWEPVTERMKTHGTEAPP